MTEDTSPKKLQINRLIHLNKLSKKLNKPITIFDLETTTYNPYVKWMGITELGFITLYPDGSSKETSALVNPERNIPPKVRELTGITNDDVRGKPTWDKWKKNLHQIAKEHLVIGYNCASFDCIVVIKQNERYGLNDTKFNYVLDAMSLPDVQGKLEKAAASFGIVSNTFHRAMADVWITALLVEAVAEKYDIQTLESCINTISSTSGNSSSGNFSPKKKRKEELTKYFEKHNSLPDLETFGKERNIKRSTVEADVIDLIKNGIMPNTVLENPPVQKWLSMQIEEAIEKCWIGDDENRLKPLFLYFSEEAPEGFDYTQLRLALAKRNKS